MWCVSYGSLFSSSPACNTRFTQTAVPRGCPQPGDGAAALGPGQLGWQPLPLTPSGSLGALQAAPRPLHLGKFPRAHFRKKERVPGRAGVREGTADVAKHVNAFGQTLLPCYFRVPYNILKNISTPLIRELRKGQN